MIGFPPPGVKIRRTLQTFFLDTAPIQLVEHEPNRVLLLVTIDYHQNVEVAFAGSLVGLSTVVTVYGGSNGAIPFYGPEEVWAQFLNTNTIGGGAVLLQSVFYD